MPATTSAPPARATVATAPPASSPVWGRLPFLPFPETATGFFVSVPVPPPFPVPPPVPGLPLSAGASAFCAVVTLSSAAVRASRSGAPWASSARASSTACFQAAKLAAE